jgi:hypothetical protein
MDAQHAQEVETNELVRKRLAKVMALRCFRNSRLEDFHAGKVPSSQAGGFSDVKVVSPYGEIHWRDLSRLSDAEMRGLIIDVVDRCYTFLTELFSSPNGDRIIERLKQRDELADRHGLQIRPDHLAGLRLGNFFHPHRAMQSLSSTAKCGNRLKLCSAMPASARLVGLGHVAGQLHAVGHDAALAVHLQPADAADEHLPPLVKCAFAAHRIEWGRSLLLSAWNAPNHHVTPASGTTECRSRVLSATHSSRPLPARPLARITSRGPIYSRTCLAETPASSCQLRGQPTGRHRPWQTSPA